MAKRITYEDRAWTQGFANALSIVQQAHDEPQILSEALMAANLTTRAKLKARGVDDYDLDVLRPVLAECKPRRKPRNPKARGE